VVRKEKAEMNVYPAASRRGWVWSTQLRMMREEWQAGEETRMITSRVEWFLGEHARRAELKDLVLSIMEN
jgi:hypothetical protein